MWLTWELSFCSHGVKSHKPGGPAIDPMFLWPKVTYTNSSLRTWLEVLEESVKKKTYLCVCGGCCSVEIKRRSLRFLHQFYDNFENLCARYNQNSGSESSFRIAVAYFAENTLQELFTFFMWFCSMKFWFLIILLAL